LFLSVKTITKLNFGYGETFEIKIRKLTIVVHILHPDNAEFGHFTLLSAEDGKEMYQEL